MFNRKPDPEDHPLEEAIDQVLNDMKGEPSETEKYAQMVDQLTKLYALKPKKRERVSPDTWATVGANLAGIVMIVGHERAHVVASKALGFVQKLR